MLIIVVHVQMRFRSMIWTRCM